MRDILLFRNMPCGKHAHNIMRLIKVAAACLNQTPLDWANNLAHIRQAIDLAKKEKVSLLCLPELSLTGYGCEDTFLSAGLHRRAEELLLEAAKSTRGIMLALGLPLSFKGALYNCACLLADGEIIGFVAKHYLAGEGIHYEPRWFKAWPQGLRAEVSLAGKSYPVGDLIFECDGVRIGFEICEDAWAGTRPGIFMAQQGVDIILNPSASHFAFGKREVRQRFVLEGSRAFGTTYVYANLVGNEAGRAIYDGGCLIAAGGTLLRSGPRFSYADVNLVSAVVDLDKCRLSRTHSAAPLDSSNSNPYQCLSFNHCLHNAEPEFADFSSALWELSADVKEEEFARAVALGLYDYLRKSRMHGFVISLSGGADSTAISALIYLMVKLGTLELGVDGFIKKLSYISSLSGTHKQQAIVSNLLTCVYQATKNSSEHTQKAAQKVAAAIGAEFLSLNIDEIVGSYSELVSQSLKQELCWDKHDTALQNIQARARGPLVWLIANVKQALLIATSNRSEAAVGYTTMDGDTCGGLSPIAGIDKAFLLHWLTWLEHGGMKDVGPIPELSWVTSQRPTAELRPLSAAQTDEQDLMPYAVLDTIERHAIRDKKMPVEVFQLTLAQFPDYQAQQLALWIERFFRLWSQNQWKRERYAPCFHLDDENLDPKTWCRFPILSGGFSSEIAELKGFAQLAEPKE